MMILPSKYTGEIFTSKDPKHHLNHLCTGITLQSAAGEKIAFSYPFRRFPFGFCSRFLVNPRLLSSDYFRGMSLNFIFLRGDVAKI